MPRFCRLFVFASTASLALAGQAFAHAHLKAAVPADKATVAASPAELDLSFSEELNLTFSGIKVTGPGKTGVKTGEASLKEDDKTLVVPVSGTLGAGSYTVEWHALSTDGHKTSGSYSFTVQP
jgi:methionine-rich copper-binding protein CopC